VASAAHNNDGSIWVAGPLAAPLLGAFLAVCVGSFDATAQMPDSPVSIPDETTTPATTIAVNSNDRGDADINDRLKQLYATIDDLGGLEIEVNSGIVTLSGEVPTRAAREQAVSLARRVENVVDVQDQIVESRDVLGRLSATVDRLQAQATYLFGLIPLFGVALLVFGAFWWVARLFAGSKPFARIFRANPFLLDLARQVVRVLIVGVGLVLSLQILDATTVLTTLLGVAGVVGLALGFALRDTLENYIASLLLSLRQPFARDDHVRIENCEGRVLRLTPRATILMTLDGNHIRIPNAKVYKSIILNYTRNPKRRFVFEVGVDTEQNLADAQELAADTLLNMDGVLDDPAPYCTVENLGDSNVMLWVFGWVDQNVAEFLRVRSEAIRLVKLAFDDAGIVMPEPIYNLRMKPLPAVFHGETASVANGAPASAREEPATAIDIAPKNELDEQIATDRHAADDDDLLSDDARKE